METECLVHCSLYIRNDHIQRASKHYPFTPAGLAAVCVRRNDMFL